MPRRGSSDKSSGRRRPSPSSPSHAPVRNHPLRAEAPPPPLMSTDILAETVDQTVHHFLNAIRRRSIEGVTQSALLINQSLVEAAERNRIAERYVRRIMARQEGGSGSTPTHSLHELFVSIPSPSLSQWIAALDALAAAAIPAALQFMQDLHTTQPFHFHTVSAGRVIGVAEDSHTQAKQLLAATQQCLGVLVNLCFLTLVAYRRSKTDMGVWARLHGSRGMRTELTARFIFNGGSATDLMNAAVLDRHVRQLNGVARALRQCFAAHLPLLIFSADQQLWSIKEEGAVSVTGHPCLDQLPRTPLYLSDQDGWVWLLVAVSLHVMGPTASVSSDATGADGSITSHHSYSPNQQASQHLPQLSLTPASRAARRSMRMSRAGASRSSSQGFSAAASSHRLRSVSAGGARASLVGDWFSEDVTSPPSPSSTVGRGPFPTASSFSRGASAMDFSVTSAPPKHGATLPAPVSASSAAVVSPSSSVPPPSLSIGSPGGVPVVAVAGPSAPAPSSESSNSGCALSAAIMSLARDPVAGGADYAAKYVSVVLSALGLFVSQWAHQRALPSHVVDVWRQRGAQFPSTQVTAAMLAQLKKEMENAESWAPVGADDEGHPSPPASESNTSNVFDEHQPIHRHTAMDDVSQALDCMTDLVVHSTPLMLRGSTNFLELLRILAVVAPIQFYHVVSARQNQTLPEVVEGKDKATGRQKLVPLSFHWKNVQRFTGAVSRLFYATSDHVLEYALAFPPTDAVYAPPEACTTIVTLGCMHVFCESVLASKVSFPAGDVASATRMSVGGIPLPAPSAFTAAAVAAGVVGGASAVANDHMLVAHWASWGRWIRAALAVYMSVEEDGGDGRCSATRFTAKDWTALVPTPNFARYCAGFAQSFGAALEDVFALVMVIKTTKSGVSGDDDDFLKHGSVDLLGHVAARRLRQLLYFLHDATLPPQPSESNTTASAAADDGVSAETCAETLLPPQGVHSAPGVIPFSILTEESFNAMALLLQRYEEALNSPGDAPSHRQYWLLAIGYLRLSSVDACCTSPSHPTGANSRAYPFAAFEGMSDYVCAGPRDSVPFLLDRSYETYDEWLKKESDSLKAARAAAAVAPSGDTQRRRSGLPSPRGIRAINLADPFELLRMEVRDACEVLRERLLMSSARFLCVALRLATSASRGGSTGYGTAAAHPTTEAMDGSIRPKSPRGFNSVAGSTKNGSPTATPRGASTTGGGSTDQHGRTGRTATSVPDSRAPSPSPSGVSGGLTPALTGAVPPPAVSQAKVYVDAFTRFLLMMDSISSNRLMSCLRTFQEELRRGEYRLHHQSASRSPGSPRAEGPEPGVGKPSPFLISDADVNEATLFEMEVALYTI